MQRITSSDPKLDTSKLLEVLEPVLFSHKLEAVEVSFQRERQGWVLRISIEDPASTTPGAGVTLDTCADVSRDISHALDVTEVITHAFHLEVGTPGVERPLFGARDYLRFVGQPAKVVFHKGLPDGQKALRGVIEAATESEVTFRVEQKTITVAADDIKSGHLVFEFGAGAKAKPSKPGREAKGKGEKHLKKGSGGDRDGGDNAGAGEGNNANERRGEKRARASGSELERSWRKRAALRQTWGLSSNRSPKRRGSTRRSSSRRSRRPS